MRRTSHTPVALVVALLIAVFVVLFADILAVSAAVDPPCLRRAFDRSARLCQKWLEQMRSSYGRGGFRTCDLSRVKRALSH
jgi:hypothetical protein